MSTEVELKFQIPELSRDAVRREIATFDAHVLPMQARYFDTASMALASASIALRLRCEGGIWVQTLKAPGEGFLKRLEHEVELLPDEPAELDITRHDGTEAGATLRSVLHGEALCQTFETDLRRTFLKTHHRGATIELALDEGVLRAGSREAELCELEFELMEGSVEALLALAAEWAQRHRLWLDVRSKAERGERLAYGITMPKVRRWSDKTLEAALRQLLASASDIAAGVGQGEHVEAFSEALQRMASLPASNERLSEFANHWIVDSRDSHNAAILLRSPLFTCLALDLTGQASR